MSGANSVDNDERLPERHVLAPSRMTELEGWSNAVVAAALRILWDVPQGDDEVQRRLARAEALRDGRAHNRRNRPIPDVGPTIPFDVSTRATG